MSERETTSALEKPEIQKGRIMASYGFGKFLFEFSGGAFTALVFIFYETNLHLSTSLTALGFIIYSIWNAINDPLLGYLTQKPTRLSNKYGRRFPWIFIGSIIWGFTLVSIFAVPDSVVADQALLFLWLVLTTCIYDFFGSLWEVNYQSIFPDKFREKGERDKAAGIATLIGVIGIALGAVLPTLIISDYNNNADYVTNAWIFCIVGIFAAIALIPGVKENKTMINRYVKMIEQEKGKKEPSFFKQMAEVFKYKNFVAFILLYLLYQSTTLSMNSSVYYVGKYILMVDPSDTTMIFAFMLIGALISIPLWLFVSKKTGDHQKTIVLAASCMAVATFPMTFLGTVTAYMIGMFFWGICFGGFWMMITPVIADIIDEMIVKTKIRKDGVLLGIRAFFGRLAIAVQSLTFWIVHVLTRFDGSSPTQSELAKWGIRFHMALIPTLFLIAGILLFMKFNSLNKEKMAEIHKQLQSIDL